jgi:hypothetical protein
MTLADADCAATWPDEMISVAVPITTPSSANELIRAIFVMDFTVLPSRKLMNRLCSAASLESSFDDRNTFLLRGN